MGPTAAFLSTRAGTPGISMSSGGTSSDHTGTSITEGPSERHLNWSRGERRRVYRTWPPLNDQFYPVRRRTHLDRWAVAQRAEHTGSDTGRDEVDLPGDHILRARWQQLAETRFQVFRIRSGIKRARNRTRQARRERAEADNAFMSVLRPFRLDAAIANAMLHSVQLPELFQHMQETRDKCEAFESSLEVLEDDLQHAQDQFDVLERRLINELRYPTGEGATRESLQIEIPPISQSELLLGLEPAKVTHSLYQSLITAFQMFRLARERRVALFTRRTRVEDQRSRLRYFEMYHPAALQHVMPLQESDLDFLRDFEVEQRKVSDEMRTLRNEIEQRIRICWEEGIIPRHAPLQEVQSWYIDDSSIGFDLDNDSTEAGCNYTSQFAILLSNPSHLLEDVPITAEHACQRANNLPGHHQQKLFAVASAEKERSIQNLVHGSKEGDKPHFINCWLLQRLRTSLHEVVLLYSLFVKEGSVGVLDIDEWQRSVLHNWFRDEAGRKSPENFEYLETSCATGPPSPPSWLSDPFSWDSDASGGEIEMDSGSLGRIEDL